MAEAEDWPAAAGAELACDAETLALLHAQELSAPLLGALHEIAFPNNLALLPASLGGNNVFRIMREVLEEMPLAPGARELDDLAADYAAIYLLGSHGASPCESYWLDPDHLLCQAPMFELRELYARVGLAVPDWRQRPDDHLVPQLQFLGRCLMQARRGRLAGHRHPDGRASVALVAEIFRSGA